MLSSEDFYRFVRYSLAQDVSFDILFEESDWLQLFEMSQKQAIAGVLFEGVKRLHREQDYKVLPSVLLLWIALCEQIKTQNSLLNKRTIEVVRHFDDAGFKSVILKGQGNALLYPNPELRTPGDVDVWVVDDYKKIHEFVIANYPEAEEAERHIEYPLFNDIHVEVHYYPSTSSTPRHNRKLKEFFKQHAEEQIKNRVTIEHGDQQISVPTGEFNVVAQLSHMLGHFLIEGFGMKQVVDYYYVLQRVERSSIDWGTTLKDLGLLNFARGMMWFQKNHIGLDDKYLIVEPDEKTGRLISEEVYEGGNMGYYDNRYTQYRKNYFSRGIADVIRLLKMSTIMPEEALWRILWKAKNQFK